MSARTLHGARSIAAWTLATALCLGAWLALGPSAVEAQSAGRVAVVRIRGPRGGRVRSLLVTSLEEAGYDVISDRDVDAEAARLGVGETPSATEWREIGRALRVRAFLDGRVSRARRSWRLEVSVRNASDGAALGEVAWSGRTPAAIEAVGRNGAERLASLLARASMPPAASEPADATRGADEDERPWYREGDEGAADEEPEEADEVGPEDAARHDVLRLSLTGGAVWRSFWANAEVYRAFRDPSVTDDSTMVERRGYESAGAGHGELGVEAEVYPGALGEAQPFPYLGVLFSFRNSVFLSSSGCRSDVRDRCERVSIGTNQMDVQAGVRGRYRFGAARRDPELFLEALYGFSTFTLDTAALQRVDRNAVIPPVEYQYVSLGGGLRYGIVPDSLTIAVRADYRPGIGIGASARNVWGLATGAPNGLLASLELIHEASWLTPGLFLSLRADYAQFQTTFRGQVGCATPSDCNIASPPWTDTGLWELWPSAPGNPEDVRGGIAEPVTDHYVRWALAVGYAFR